MKVERAVTHLFDSIASGRLAQAYLVLGSVREEGEAVAAQVLMRLFCGAAEPPCGTCRECVQVEARTHPDILWIEPQKRSRIIGVEQVRALQARVYQTTVAGGWKACVLRDADRMGPSAANAFLKTLEEPPSRTLFLLLAENASSLLPTIVSRCQKLTISQGSAMLSEAWRDRVLEILASQRASAVSGGFSRADRLDSLLGEIKAAAETEIKSEVAEDRVEEGKDTLDARVNARYRETRTAVMRTVLHWYRDLLLLVCESDRKLLYFPDWLEPLEETAKTLDQRRAVRNLDIVTTMFDQMERNVPEGPVLSMGLPRLP